MFTTFHKSPLRLSIFAACIFTAGAACAHPEMDKWGRDITSGPLPDLSEPTSAAAASAMTEEAASGEITGSIDQPGKCSRQSPQACAPAVRPDRPERVRPDY